MTAPAGSNRAPLTLPQRIWFRPHEPHNVAMEFERTPAFFRLDGPIDYSLFARALGQLRERHPILRTRYGVEGGELYQEEATADPIPLRIIDLSPLNEADRPLALWSAVKRTFDQPPQYDLGQPMASWLFRHTDVKHDLAIVIDHIALDNRSMEIIVKDTFALYRALATSEPALLDPITKTYADHARAIQARQGPEQLARNLEWWRERMDGAASPDLRDPAKAPYPDGSARAVAPIEISSSTQEAAQAFARSQGLTLPMLLVATCGVQLSRWSGQRRMIAGFVVDERPPAMAAVAGSFVRTTPLCLDIRGAPTGRDLAARAREACIAASHPQRMVDPADIRDLTRVLINIRKSHFSAARYGTAGRSPSSEVLKVMPLPSPRPLQNRMHLDLQVYFTEEPRRLVGHIVYAADRLNSVQATAFAAGFDGLLAAIVDRPDEPVTLNQMPTTQQDLTPVS